MRRGQSVELRAGSAISEGLGLQHIWIAARAAGAQISLTQEEDIVTFQAVMDTQVVPDVPVRVEAPESDAPDPPALPEGLMFCYIDDSPMAHLILSGQLKRLIPGSTIQCYGEVVDEVDAFTQAVISKADVAVLDQNITYTSGNILGTDLIRQLREAGFGGLLCIRSANTDEDERDFYLRFGAHCVIDKGMAPKEVVRCITTAYWEHCTPSDGRQSPPPPVDGPAAQTCRDLSQTPTLHTLPPSPPKPLNCPSQNPPIPPPPGGLRPPVSGGGSPHPNPSPPPVTHSLPHSLTHSLTHQPHQRIAQPHQMQRQCPLGGRVEIHVHRIAQRCAYRWDVHGPLPYCAAALSSAVCTTGVCSDVCTVTVCHSVRQRLYRRTVPLCAYCRSVQRCEYHTGLQWCTYYRRVRAFCVSYRSRMAAWGSPPWAAPSVALC